MQREKPHKVICKSCHKPIDYTAYRNLDKLYCPFCGTENHLDQNNQDTDDTCDFDVFLCYNAVDRPAVKEIAKTLQQRKLLPWFDEWALRPGVPWQITIMDQIKRVKSVAVFVGRDNVGPWEDKESRYFLREFVKK